MKRFVFVLVLFASCLISGCATNRKEHAATLSESAVSAFSPETRAKILSVDPAHVTEREVKELLSNAPAPRIISIHGGIFPIKSGMNSFAQFLIGMGYPESSIRHPADGLYTYGYYNKSEEIAGTIAWYYEHDGLRPMIIGHSQGGIQAIRILHLLAGNRENSVAVWNPVTQRKEDREEIRDPLTGTNRPVVGLRVGFASAAAAGGLARGVQWDMNSRLREIPDSVEEFTGFQKGLDPFGGDYFGYGPKNDYHAAGSAKVRNVRLPSGSSHWTIPYAKSLLTDPAARKWIEDYQPRESEELPERTNAQMLWAAEIWYSIKKHWVLELQRLIQARNGES